ncbi:pantetheine-phosphate adenylyltransferase [bacterium]|nr:pantetheine-phosphate adenylyltransferase [bacterium]
MKKALFPGTFDPFTNGHEDIVKRGLELFDEVVVAVGVNTGKQHLFSLENRISWIKDLYKDEPRVTVAQYDALTALYAQEIGANFILRGLRTTQDFTYEKQIAHVNEELAESIRSVFIMSDFKNSSVSSTIVRDLIRYKGNFSKYVPSSIHKKILEL